MYQFGHEVKQSGSHLHIESKIELSRECFRSESKTVEASASKTYSQLLHWCSTVSAEMCKSHCKEMWSFACLIRSFLTCCAVIKYDPPDPCLSFPNAFSSKSVENSPKQTYS